MSKKKADDKPFTMLRRVPAGFVPLTAYDHEMIERVPMFADVRAAISMPRSLPRHRFYWVLLGIVAENQDRWRTAEDLHTAIKVKLGYIEDFVLIDGSLLIRPRSTNFDSMDELEFQEYLEAALAVISTDIIPGLDIKALKSEGQRKIGKPTHDRYLSHA
ncbi:DUF1367 family protein [Mesorhizobium sp. Cs1299R1N3]|uniref:DUF1367 family protein n=1 Tax=Mesorhizobium sp. Cs1299R1N3 TaxID=3015173 RepID=UPI00301D3523